MKRILGNTFLLGAVALMSGCGGGGSDADGGAKPLVMFCAAGMKKPVTEIAKAYEEEYGVKVQLDFAGSGTLLAKLDIGKGDIYLAADSSYTNMAKERDLVAETMPVAFMRAGFGVAKGNPKELSKLSDVQNPDLRFGIGNPEAASIGKFTKKVLSKHDLWEGFEPTVLFPTVNEIANAAKLGTIDAGIMWDAITHQYPELQFVNVPEFDAEMKDITVAVLTKSEQPTEALKFCRYLTAKDKGLKIFQQNHYEPAQGDEWAESPELVLFSGAMLRPAIQETIKKFEEREGVKIKPTYNGCGILVSQMKAGQNPDAYFSCDMTFMTMVEDRFSPSTTVSANTMVILVKKGNPKNVTTLEDLKREGIKVGFSHPDKSALGYLTQRLLEQEGLWKDITEAKDAIPAAATGDFLVNQIRSNALDAVVVYRSNAMANPTTVNDCDIVEIDRPNAIAEQPYAVGKDSPYPNLAARFFEACVSAQGKEEFLKYGFRWELDPDS